MLILVLLLLNEVTVSCNIFGPPALTDAMHELHIQTDKQKDRRSRLKNGIKITIKIFNPG